MTSRSQEEEVKDFVTRVFMIQKVSVGGGSKKVQNYFYVSYGKNTPYVMTKFSER